MSDKVLISPAELNAMIPSPHVVVIDTRSPDNYAAGHIAGAVNLFEVFTFLAMSTPEGVDELKATFAKHFGAAGLSGAETAVFVEESMNSGFGMSCRGYFLMQFLGYPKAQVLHGGLSAWKAAGLPLTTEVPVVTPKTFPVVDTKQDVIINYETMLAALSDSHVVKMDVRDVDEWVGTSSSPYGPDFAPRKGRIPGAKWLEWYRMMKPTAAGPMFKSKDEILAECATIGVTPETPVFLYCFKGARASNTLVALKEAGIKDVRMYFGSWNEWSRMPELPIEAGLPFAVPAEKAMAAD
jgi:thiosulfate/3-mercaptopyruvate sulfurtransferase